MGVKTLLTVEEFERLSLPPEKRFELDEGEVVEMTFPTYGHNYVVGNIYYLLRSFVKEKSRGLVLPSDCGFRLSDTTLRGPDVAFLSAARATVIDWESSVLHGAPDLAVEVVSPSDTASEMNRKVGQYLSAGATAVWVVYPETRQVHVFSGDGSQLLHESDTLSASALLPGFSAPVRAIFD